MKSIVTTKQGDEGKTRLPDGTWLSKSSNLIECLGALDTLRTCLALLKNYINESKIAEKDVLEQQLFWLLHCCFITGTQLADPHRHVTPPNHPQINLELLEKLESYQTQLESKLLLPRKFIVCGSNTLSAFADYTATQARNFERKLISVLETQPEINNKYLIPFYNRLSDYLFVLARVLDNNEFITVDYSKI